MNEDDAWMRNSSYMPVEQRLCPGPRAMQNLEVIRSTAHEHSSSTDTNENGNTHRHEGSLPQDRQQEPNNNTA